MHLPRLLPVVALCAAAVPPLGAQSIAGSVRSATILNAFAAQPPFVPAVSQTPANTALPSSFALTAASVAPQTHATTRGLLMQQPVVYRLEEATSAAPGGAALTGVHETVLSLAVTREYGGELLVRWNGIEQNDGEGSLSVEVDVDADGTFEFAGTHGETRNARFARSWGPAAPLQVLVRTAANAGGLVSSAFKGIVEIEFAPDSATVAPGSFVPFGFGCGSVGGGAPVLNGTGVDGPLVGRTFGASIAPLPAGTIGVAVLVGFHEIPPLHLGPIGMELCFLFVQPELAVPVGLGGGGASAIWSASIANDTGLVGQPFFAQAFVVDPAAPGLGAILSNPCRGVIGGD